MTSQFFDMMLLWFFLFFFFFFRCCFVSYVDFSYWSKFHADIIIGSGVMKISFYKGLTRNPEIKNTAVWVLHNIYRLGLNDVRCYWIRCYWMLENARIEVCTVFELLKFNQHRGQNYQSPSHPSSLGLRLSNLKELEQIRKTSQLHRIIVLCCNIYIVMYLPNGDSEKKST